MDTVGFQPTCEPPSLSRKRTVMANRSCVPIPDSPESEPTTARVARRMMWPPPDGAASTHELLKDAVAGAFS